MAVKVGSRSPGSIVLEILIVILVVALIYAIVTPQSQWQEQALRSKLCHERMENIHLAVSFYHKKTGRYTSDLQQVLSFAERESITVHPAGFKLDRLTREETGIDSFIVDYFDPYGSFNHFEATLDTLYPDRRRDSLVLTIKPKPQWSFLPRTQYTFAADGPITAALDDRGSQGTFMDVGAQGVLRRSQILAETIEIPAARYIYFIEPNDSLGLCPTTGKPYTLTVNVKMAILAEVNAKLDQQSVDASVGASELLSSIVVFRWLKQADAMANAELVKEKLFEKTEDSIVVKRGDEFLNHISDSLRAVGQEALAKAMFDSTAETTSLTDSSDLQRWEALREKAYAFMNGLKEDSSFQAVRDDIVNRRKDELAKEFVETMIADLNKAGVLSLSETGVINTIADSIAYYSEGELIKNRLFKAHTDSITKRFLTREDIAGLFQRLRYTEDYRVGQVDSVGVTIACPIEGEFVFRERSFLDKIFPVKGEPNHGSVKNGDLSWDEKR